MSARVDPTTRILNMLLLHGQLSRSGIAWWGMLSNHKLAALDELVRTGRVTKERIAITIPRGHHEATRLIHQTIYRLSMVEIWRRALSVRLERYAAMGHCEMVELPAVDQTAIDARSVIGEPGWEMVQDPDGRWGWKAPWTWRDRQAKKVADRKARPAKHPATPDGAAGLGACPADIEGRLADVNGR